MSIEKRDGSPRILRVPTKSLKSIQRAILDKILVTRPLPSSVYGFGKGKSIVENARLHSKSPYLLNADIKDFFPSVYFKRIEKIFADLGASPDIISALTRLTQYRFSLPQGAPTSPYLASLVLTNLDKRIIRLCLSNRLFYSRYFDDITISGGARVHEIFNTIEQIIKEEGYEVHKGPDKLRFSGPSEDKLVTGISIRNGKLFVETDELGQYIRALQRDGQQAIRHENLFKEQTSIKGKIAFVTQVDKEVGQELAAAFEKITW